MNAHFPALALLLAAASKAAAHDAHETFDAGPRGVVTIAR